MMGLMLWAVAIVAVPQSRLVVDELRVLAAGGTDAALLALVAEWPDEAQEAIRQMLILAESEREPSEPLAAAERVAAAFSEALQDTLLQERVAFFRSLSLAGQRSFVLADSIRREGNEALYRDGVKAAMRRWRESLRLSSAIGDSVGMAGALGNVGAGFYVGGVLDSAQVYLRRAGGLAERAGDFRVAGNAAVNSGSVAKLRGDLRTASEHYTRALSLHRRVGNDRGVAADQNNLGLIAQELGDIQGAREAFESALALNQRHENLSRAADNLLNLGRLASSQADYDTASALYRKALSTYRDANEPVNAALAQRNLGLLDVRRGDYPSALESLKEALRIYEETGEASEAISTRRTLATVHAAIGDLQAALGELARAEEVAGAQAGADATLLADLALARGDLAAQFNQLVAAERGYERALGLYREANNLRGQGEAQQSQGWLLLLRGDFTGARRVLELVLRAQETSGDPRSAAWTRVLLASAIDELGDTGSARRALEDAIDAFRRLHDPVTEAATLGTLAELDVEAGLALAAEARYDRALRLIEDLPAATVSWRLRTGLGRALRSRGALPQAARQFRAAVAEVERVAGTLILSERRAAFLADKWDVYEELAMLERARGNHIAAFEVSERMRARQMLDLLARGRTSGAAGAPTELTVQEQNLRRGIAELTAELEGSGGVTALRGPDVSAPDLDVIREALASTQQRYAELLLEIRERSPEYAALVAAETVPSSEIMAGLEPDQALLEFLLGDSASVVFVVTADTVATVDLGVDRKAIVGLVDFVRGTMIRPEQGRPPRDLWKAPLRRLHQYLVQPVEEAGLLQGKRRLLIAPHAELHYLPFDALVASEDPDRFLIEHYEVAYVPSASVWTRLRERPSPDGLERILALAPREEVLPGSRQEVEAIGRIFGNRTTVMAGADATEGALTRSAAGYDLIHLATYGVLNKHNPLFSYVELNAAGENDGRLEVHEVFGLNLNAHLVVLSACQTGLGSGALADVPAGDDWVGLVRAFLYAGAANVLATIWPVEDRTTARLMEQFYRYLESGSPTSEAITLAKRASLSNRETAHPFYWAGFVLVGGS